MISVSAVAKRLSLAPATVYRMIHRGEIPAYRVGNAYRVDVDELETYIQRSRVDPET